MTQDTRTPQPFFAPFTPPDRRSRRRVPSWLTRDIKWTDVVLAIVAVIFALGWTFASPAKRIGALELRAASIETRVDRLENKIEFTNYLQCVQLRRTDPTLLPRDCMPIIEKKEVGR